MVDLPQPDVRVTHGEQSSDAGTTHVMEAVLSRDSTAKSYRGTGSTPAEAAKGLIDKILADPHTGEYIPRDWSKG